jgi:hypothetical protein
MKLSSEEIRFRIIKKLVRHRVWGTYHIDEDDIPKGMPSALRKEILRELDNIVREGLIVRFPHLGKKKVYLNTNRRKEIEAILKRYL